MRFNFQIKKSWTFKFIDTYILFYIKRCKTFREVKELAIGLSKHGGRSRQASLRMSIYIYMS